MRYLLTSYCVISIIFIALLLFCVFSSISYWENSLQPRLYLAAKTQAQVLATSQIERLSVALQSSQPDKLSSSLYNSLQELLLVEDPAIGGHMILGIALQIDYNQIDVAENSLNFKEGITRCENCFHFTLPLLSDDTILLGIADIIVSDRYLQKMIADIQSPLYINAIIIVTLVLVVWAVVIALFHRINRAKQAVETSDRAKTRFMANITHELRTPLNAILGYAQLYKNNAELKQDVKTGMNTIDRSANHLLLMINDILDFSRGTEHTLTLYPEQFPLGSFLNNLVEMNRVSAKMKNIVFDYLPDTSLPDSIYADEKRLRQVLLNLLNNAVKFTDTGRVQFIVNCRPMAKQQAQISFHIRDSGIGIAKTDLQQIFMPFVQLENKKTKAEGSGLGLSITQRILKQMNSTLHVESKPQHGSHFWFELRLPTGTSHKNVEKTENRVINPPDDNTLIQLTELAERHDILKLRAALKILEQQESLTPFCEELSIYLRHYQFQGLSEWLKTFYKSY